MPDPSILPRPATTLSAALGIFLGRQARRETGAATFMAAAAQHMEGLSAAELGTFERDGWVGTYPLLTPAGAAALMGSQRKAAGQFARKGLDLLSEAGDAFDRRPWFKSIHAYIPAFHELVSHPAIVRRVASILGPDIIAWGVASTAYRPGQRHRWHVDVEHRRWPGVSVFIGLKNLSRASTLKVISGSHRIALSPGAMGVLDDGAVLAASRRLDPGCALVPVDVKEGEFFVFHGRTWHGSYNASWRIRRAIIAQYARPDAEIAIPLNYDEPVRWHPYRPPCILVSGHDRFGINRLVMPPSAGARA